MASEQAKGLTQLWQRLTELKELSMETKRLSHLGRPRPEPTCSASFLIVTTPLASSASGLRVTRPPLRAGCWQATLRAKGALLSVCFKAQSTKHRSTGRDTTGPETTGTRHPRQAASRSGSCSLSRGLDRAWLRGEDARLTFMAYRYVYCRSVAQSSPALAQRWRAAAVYTVSPAPAFGFCPPSVSVCAKRPQTGIRRESLGAVAAVMPCCPSTTSTTTARRA